jgi:hypothetical protein
MGEQYDIYNRKIELDVKDLAYSMSYKQGSEPADSIQVFTS